MQRIRFVQRINGENIFSGAFGRRRPLAKAHGFAGRLATALAFLGILGIWLIWDFDRDGSRGGGKYFLPTAEAGRVHRVADAAVPRFDLEALQQYPAETNGLAAGLRCMAAGRDHQPHLRDGPLDFLRAAIEPQEQRSARMGMRGGDRVVEFHIFHSRKRECANRFGRSSLSQRRSRGNAFDARH
ncbi:MAG: hypothetical protein JOZ72_19625 [Alphaproteobacteria bacterium]|nr:hypothetical protein [Alphaproteobacteria bacterium]